MIVRIKLKLPNHRYPSCHLVGRYLTFPVTTTRCIPWVEIVFPLRDLAACNKALKLKANIILKNYIALQKCQNMNVRITCLYNEQ